MAELIKYFKIHLLLIAIICLGCDKSKFKNFAVLYKKNSTDYVTLLVTKDGIKKWTYSSNNNPESTGEFAYYLFDRVTLRKLTKIGSFIEKQSVNGVLYSKDKNNEVSLCLISDTSLLSQGIKTVSNEKDLVEIRELFIKQKGWKKSESDLNEDEIYLCPIYLE